MKQTLVLAMALCLFSSVAYATDTRIQSMGGKEKAWTVEDETNALFFPATLVMFPNVIYVDAGLSPMYAASDAAGSNVPYNVGFGTHYAFGENTVLGFYGSSLSRSLSGNLLGRAFNGRGDWATLVMTTTAKDESGPQAINNADHQGSVVFGQRFGAARLGASISIWGDEYSIEDPKVSYEKKGGTIIEGSLGFGYDIDQNNNFDLSLRFWSGTFDDETWITDGGGQIVTRLKSDSNFGFDLYGRGIFSTPGGERIVPYINVGMEGAGITWNSANGGVKDEFSSFHLVAGTDLRIQPLENVFVYPGVGIAVMTENLTEGVVTAENEIQKRTLIAPFVAASVDARVANWLSIRFAARQSIVFDDLHHGVDGDDMQKGEGAEGTAKGMDNETLTEFLLGAGLHFGPVTIDWMLNPAWFLEGMWSNDGEQVNLTLVDEDGDGAVDGVQSPARTYGNGFASQLAVKFVW
jgi:hypothetical protein